MNGMPMILEMEFPLEFVISGSENSFGFFSGKLDSLYTQSIRTQGKARDSFRQRVNLPKRGNPGSGGLGRIKKGCLDFQILSKAVHADQKMKLKPEGRFRLRQIEFQIPGFMKSPRGC